jgi:hypothetical protein
MSRSKLDTLQALGHPVRILALDEIRRGAPIMTVVEILAGITGAVAAGAITIYPQLAEEIHAKIDEAVSRGLIAHKLGAKS